MRVPACFGRPRPRRGRARRRCRCRCSRHPGGHSHIARQKFGVLLAAILQIGAINSPRRSPQLAAGSLP
eukprot:scaffold31611_cov59-Phaeocystis_antarctica.AAC.3